MGMMKNTRAKDCNKKGYLVHVKIFYRHGNHKYANLFSKQEYNYGLRLGTIIGYKPMNWLERVIFRNCL